VMSASLGVNQYRQVATGFMMTKLKHQIKLSIEEVVEEEETLFDAQAGHSAEVAAIHYAKSQFSFKHVDSVMLQHFFKCSVEWQTLLGESSVRLCGIYTPRNGNSDNCVPGISPQSSVSSNLLTSLTASLPEPTSTTATQLPAAMPQPSSPALNASSANLSARDVQVIVDMEINEYKRTKTVMTQACKYGASI
jgi:hypothetical protein